MTFAFCLSVRFGQNRKQLSGHQGLEFEKLYQSSPYMIGVLSSTISAKHYHQRQAWGNAQFEPNSKYLCTYLALSPGLFVVYYHRLAAISDNSRFQSRTW